MVQTVVRLFLSLMVTVVLHAFLVPVTVLGLRGHVWGASPPVLKGPPRKLTEPHPEEAEPAQHKEPRPNVRFGKDDTPDRLTAAWIAHEAFQQLIGPQSSIDQPALQRRADPRPKAPLRLDPEPELENMVPGHPAVNSNHPARGVRSEPVRLANAQPVRRQQAPTDSLVVLGPKTAGDGVDEPLRPHRQSFRRPITAVDNNGQVDFRSAPVRRFDRASASLDASEAPPKASSAARSDREASPSSRIDGGRLRPGRVIVGKGIEIKTVAPRFGIASRLSAVPDDPSVLVVFNRKGQVIAARLIRSSGYAGVDGPILSSLYKWWATGELLKDLDGNLNVEVKLLLR